MSCFSPIFAPLTEKSFPRLCACPRVFLYANFFSVHFIIWAVLPDSNWMNDRQTQHSTLLPDSLASIFIYSSFHRHWCCSIISVVWRHFESKCNYSFTMCVIFMVLRGLHENINDNISKNIFENFAIFSTKNLDVRSLVIIAEFDGSSTLWYRVMRFYYQYVMLMWPWRLTLNGCRRSTLWAVTEKCADNRQKCRLWKYDIFENMKNITIFSIFSKF